MKIRKTVFGSAYERALYKALVTRWSDKLRIYSNLPFFSIIEVSESDVPPNERNFLLKTSVDYTLCDLSDQPLLSIEFDGLGEGFSREGEYVPRYVSSRDPNREWKLGLKLQVCNQALYPLFIVSYKEATPIGRDLNVAIVDGIIGSYLAARGTQGRLDELYELDRERFVQMPRHARDEYIQDLVFQAEIEMSLTWNPVSRKLAELQEFLAGKGIRTESWEPLYEPEKGTEGWSWQRVKRVGCKATVQTPLGPVTEVAWMRNIEGGGVFACVLIDEIARLLAWKKAVDLFGGREPSQ